MHHAWHMHEICGIIEAIANQIPSGYERGVAYLLNRNGIAWVAWTVVEAI